MLSVNQNKPKGKVYTVAIKKMNYFLLSERNATTYICSKDEGYERFS